MSRGPRPGSAAQRGEDRSTRPFEKRPDRGRPGQRPSRGDRLLRKPVPGEAFNAPREDGLDRVSKIIARAGIASRRDAEAMIEAGRVSLNGQTLTSPGAVAGPHDAILVDGQPLPDKEKTRLWLYHKPAGLVTTAHDPEGRPTVFDNLPEGLPRVVSVGRLDINTEGLLLLTNDGGLAQVLAHPRTGWMRRYRVRAHGTVEADAIERLSDGIEVDGMQYGPIEGRIDRVQGDNVWLTLGLREGKNREVKRVLEHLGLKVNRLIRLSFGPFQLGEMAEGTAEEVRTRVLRDQLGPELIRAAEAEFDLPAHDKLREARHVEREPRGDARPPRPVRQAPDGGPGRGERPMRRPATVVEPPPSGDLLERSSGRQSPARAIWRDAEIEQGRPKGTRRPRRGDDPASARAEAAARPRERAGKVVARSGRTILVERVAGTPPPDTATERLVRKPRREREQDIPAAGRRDERRAGPARAASRAKSDRPDGQRGARPDGAWAGRQDRDARTGDAPRRGEERPRGPDRGGPSKGGFAKSGPRSGRGDGPARPPRGRDGAPRPPRTDGPPRRPRPR